MKKSILNICIIFMISLLSICTPEMKSQNLEWMYFHDIKSISALEAIDNYIYIGRINETVAEAMRLNLETLVLETIDTMNYTITSFKKDLDGTIWIGTSGQGLVEYNGKIIKKYTYENSGLPEYFGQKYTVPIRSIEVDKYGNKWLGTYDGLIKFDGLNTEIFKIKTNPLDPDENNIPKIQLDKSHEKIWMNIQTGGIATFSEGQFEIIDYKNISNNLYSFSDIAIDKSDNIWFATPPFFKVGNIGGIVKYDGTNWQEFNNSNSPLLTNKGFTIDIDQENRIWIGTRNEGLIRFDGQNCSIFDKSNSNIGGNKVYLSTIDMYGNIWMSIYSDDTNTEQIGLEVFREGGVLLPTNVKEALRLNNEKTPSIYPNPARDIIRVTDLIKRERNFRIANLYGQTVLEGTFYHEIDISKLISGFYFLNVDGFNLKFVKL